MKAPIVNTIKSEKDLSNFRKIKLRTDVAKKIPKKHHFDEGF